MPDVGQLSVDVIGARECYWFLMHRHYAKRVPSITHAFGLLDGGFMSSTIRGVVTFGTPASATLRDGVAGPEYSAIVLELNRLALLDNQPNEASRLVSGALRLLPSPTIVVSYADCSQGHVGYVYQACNFIYTGLSAKRTDWKIKGLEHLHGQTIADISRGQIDRVGYMRDKFGDDFYLEDRSRKHRYLYLIGDRRQRAAMKAALRYKTEPYPKRAI
jgi:hypothetical protein